SGTQYTKVTVDGKGRVTSAAQLASADVVTALGYTPMNSVSAAPPITLTGAASTTIIGLASSTVTAGTYGSSFTISIVTVDIYGRLTTVASQTLRIADANSTGVVSIGANITVNGAGQISVTSGNVIAALGYTPVSRAGDVMTGGLTTPALSVTNAMGLGVASPTTGAMLEASSTTSGFLMPRMTTVQRNAIVSGAAQNGLQIYNTTNGAFEYYDSGASTWKQIVTNFSAMTALNGSTSSTQTFAFGSAGTAFGVATANGVHTFSIPMAASAGVTQGALSNTQYQSLIDKVTTVSGAAGQIVITGGVSAPVIGLASSTVTAGTYGSSSTISVITYDTFGRATGVASSSLRLATTAATGVVQVGSNITVTAGTISITSGNVIAAFGSSLSGDVTGSLSATVVAAVGGKTAAQVATAVTDVASATSANSSGTIVRRDANGNFIANNITTVQDMTVQRNLRIQNGLTNSIGIFTPIGTPNYDIILPDNGVVPPAGYSLAISAATSAIVQTTWVPMMSGSIASGTMYVGNASGVATAVLMSGDATMTNSGAVNLASVGAGVTSGTQYTKVTVDGKGRITSGSALASSDVVTALGYTPAGAVSTTAPIILTGSASAPVIGLASSTVTAATYGSSFTIPIVTVDIYGRLTSVASQTLRVADAVSPGVVQVGSNITVTAGTISLTAANVTSALTFTPVNKAGDTMTGALTIPSAVVSTTLGIGTATNNASAILDIVSTNKGILIPRMTLTDRGSIAGVNGLTIYNTTSNELQYFDGTASLWKTLGTTSATMTSLNGSVASVQTFASGTTGTTFNISTNTGTGAHTFNVPAAVTAGVTQGTITNTEFTTFWNKVTSVTGTSGQILITGGVSTPTVGLVSTTVTAATYGSSFTIPIVTVDMFGRLTSVTSQTLRVADANTQGVVQIGNNITVTAGTISLTANNIASATGLQAANSFYAGPLSGGASYPSFRSIASTDLPTSGATGVWLNGGNSFGTTTVFGTKDNQAISVQTNGVTRMSIETTGTVSFAGQAHANLNALGAQSGATVNADANSGNVISFTTNSGNATSQTVALTNVRIGAAYTVIVSRNDANDYAQTSITCNGAGALYIPAIGARSAAGVGKSVYTFIYDGTTCLVTWITGF
ncbi:MAG: hypothetical protein V4654_11155, partial [Bdellovibrionota bacterium]